MKDGKQLWQRKTLTENSRQTVKDTSLQTVTATTEESTCCLCSALTLTHG